MYKSEALNDVQRELVANHLNLVEWVIYDHIKVNESILGFSFEDIYQEGCICLCKAALTYDETISSFQTYARIVVRNGLFNYCNRMLKIQKRLVPMREAPYSSSDKDGRSTEYELSTNDECENLLAQFNVTGLFEAVQGRYSGITRLGIEALKLKTLGYTGADIARLWGVKQNHLGSWISRAKTKLLKDEQFLTELRYSIGA